MILVVNINKLPMLLDFKLIKSDFLHKRCKLGNEITSKLCLAYALPLNHDKLVECVST